MEIQRHGNSKSFLCNSPVVPFDSSNSFGASRKCCAAKFSWWHTPTGPKVAMSQPEFPRLVKITDNCVTCLYIF